MYCNNCGGIIDDNSRFCIHCGNQINNSNYSDSINNNINDINENSYNENDNYNNQHINNQKQQFINTLSYEPIGMWGYFGYEILFAIPIIGFILMIVFSITSNNVNVKNFSRAYLIISILGLIIAFIICTSMGISLFNFFNRYY